MDCIMLYPIVILLLSSYCLGQQTPAPPNPSSSSTTSTTLPPPAGVPSSSTTTTAASTTTASPLNHLRCTCAGCNYTSDVRGVVLSVTGEKDECYFLIESKDDGMELKAAKEPHLLSDVIQLLAHDRNTYFRSDDPGLADGTIHLFPEMLPDNMTTVEAWGKTQPSALLKNLNFSSTSADLKCLYLRMDHVPHLAYECDKAATKKAVFRFDSTDRHDVYDASGHRLTPPRSGAALNPLSRGCQSILCGYMMIMG